MPNPNIVPRPENLTRAGQGQPPKPNKAKPKLITLNQETIQIINNFREKKGLCFGDAIDEIVNQWSSTPAQTRSKKA